MLDPHFSDKILSMKIHTFRLKSGAMFRAEIEKYAREKKFSAGIILSAVGALKDVRLRMAGATSKKQVIKNLKGDCEIVSIEGTLSKDDCHIHVSVSDKNGAVYGGHLKEGIVQITAEGSLLELSDRKFSRELDKETGFEELVVK